MKEKDFMNKMHCLMEIVNRFSFSYILILSVFYLFNPKISTGLTCVFVALIGVIVCCFERAIECYANYRCFTIDYSLSILLFGISLINVSRECSDAKTKNRLLDFIIFFIIFFDLIFIRALFYV